MGQITTTLYVKDNATKTLNSFARSIKNIDKAIRGLSTASNVTVNMNQQFNQMAVKAGNLNQQINRTAANTRNAANAQREHNKELQRGVGFADNLATKIKRMAGAYLGVMGTRAVVNASDTLIGAENKFNALNGNNQNLTNETIDKIYQSSQISRSGFVDNVSNVSKMLTNASRTFQGNTDLAIKFNELMNKSYKLGGASAAEQASSMYQMIQALGSGVLQGDELRSVREGAPLAYQAIEKYAQGVYGANENLKDLASEGKITSDMVVKAMLTIGDEIEENFGKTAITWSDRWTQIKNIATRAIAPISEKLKEIWNSDEFQKFLTIMQEVLSGLSVVLYIILSLFQKIFEFVVNNWSAFRPLFLGIVAALSAFVLTLTLTNIKMGLLAIKTGAAAVATALLTLKTRIFGNAAAKAGAKAAIGFLPVYLVCLIIVAVIMGIIYAMKKWEKVAEYVGGSIFIVIEAIKMLLSTFVVFIFGMIHVILIGFDWVANGIYKAFTHPLAFAEEKIGKFTNWVLNKLMPLAEFWDELFDTNLTGKLNKMKTQTDAMIKSAQDKLPEDKFKTADSFKKWYQSTSSYNNVMGDGINFGDAWSNGKKWGAGVHEKLNNLDNLFNTDTGDEPSVEDLLEQFDNATGYEKETAENTDEMSKNVKEMADILRKLADRTVTNRYTSTQIDVNMVNNNNISKEVDGDGLFTNLESRLREELLATAEGVY